MADFKLKLEVEFHNDDEQALRAAADGAVAGLNKLMEPMARVATTQRPQLERAIPDRPPDGEPTEVVERPRPARQAPARRVAPARSASSRRSPNEGSISLGGTAEDFGAPTQQWTQREKVLWTMHVVSSRDLAARLTPAQIAASYNANFRATGQLRSGDVGKCLRRLQGKRPPLVDTDEGGWFLMEAGKTQMIEFVDGLNRRGSNGG